MCAGSGLGYTVEGRWNYAWAVVCRGMTEPGLKSRCDVSLVGVEHVEPRIASQDFHLVFGIRIDTMALALAAPTNDAGARRSNTTETRGGFWAEGLGNNECWVLDAG
ncbi:hypothetical protein CHU98_g4578 [Xylaria longipes]|nr:hypothetical protein CHU98_g4578 [Xylaria longipes]